MLRNTIGESPLDKLYNHTKVLFSLKQIYLSGKGLHHCYLLYILHAIKSWFSIFFCEFSVYIDLGKLVA